MPIRSPTSAVTISVSACLVTAVLLLSLRHMSIDESEISAARVFAVFSFSRLLSAVPLTPGGVGVIDLGYVGGLTAGIPEGDKPEVVAAILIFRLLTFGIQIPLGAFTYFIWLKKQSWRKPAPDEPVVATADFTVDLAAKQVIRSDGSAVRLTPTEWQLLEILDRNSGRLVTQRHLLETVWGLHAGADTNVLRVHMAHVRRKLEPDPARPRYLVTEPGVGYRLRVE